MTITVVKWQWLYQWLLLLIRMRASRFGSVYKGTISVCCLDIQEKSSLRQITKAFSTLEMKQKQNGLFFSFSL